ncbi:MAG: winged helix-turn-helix domain-containing protein [Anaerolineae bacterium]|nr:winged helix-turn-helix domain-containing protein [Anaerolineae bacterium]
MPSYSTEIVSLDGLKLDQANRVVSGAVIQVLTRTEARVLEVLMANAPRAVSREVLIKVVWETEYTQDSELLEPHIKSLRRKLAANQVWKIETVRGLGYRLVRQNF